MRRSVFYLLPVWIVLSLMAFVAGCREELPPEKKGEYQPFVSFTNTVEVSTSTPELDHDNNLAVVPLGSPRVTCVPWAAG